MLIDCDPHKLVDIRNYNFHGKSMIALKVIEWTIPENLLSDHVQFDDNHERIMINITSQEQ